MENTGFPKGQGPDQGFAWVVAVACFFINFLMAGLARSAGVLYVALIELYGASRETATMPFSIRVSVRNLTGPIVGMLGQRYGIRAVTISGGVFASVGGILCYFAPNILWITVFWGVIHGTGFGLSTVIHMVIINQYFDKYRATALGFAYTGDCIGTFVLPILIDSLLYDFGVQETFLIISAIVLNVIPLAMLLKSPPWLERPPKIMVTNHALSEHNSSFYENKGFTDSQASSKDLSNYCNESAGSCPLGSTHHAVPSYEEAIQSTNYPQNYLETKLDAADLLNADAYSQKSEYHCKDDQPYNDQIRSTKSCKNAQFEGNLAVGGEPDAFNTLVTDCCSASAGCRTVVSEIDNVSILKKTDGVTEIVMESRDLNHGNVLKTTITEHTGNGCDTVLRIRTLSECSRLGIKSCESRSSSFNEPHAPYLNDCRGRIEPTPVEVCQELKLRTGNVEVIQNPVSSSITISYDSDTRSKNPEHIAFPIEQVNDSIPIATEQENILCTVLKNAAKVNIKPIFFLISVTAAVYTYLFIAIMTVIIDFGIGKGVDSEQGKYFIVAFSAADLIGRLGFGVVIDRKWAPMKHYVALTVGGMGFVVSVIPFVSGFLPLMTSMSAFGLVQGGVAIMFPILVGEYMEKKEESIAMGCLNFYGGLLMLTMAPMIGFFRDKYGTYDSMFHLVGLCCLVVGLIWTMEPLILKCQNRSKAKSELAVSDSEQKQM